MPGPFIARRLNGKLIIGFIGNAKRQTITCHLCGAIERDVPIGGFSDQWALDHLEAVHADLYDECFGPNRTRSLDLYHGGTFTFSVGTH